VPELPEVEALAEFLRGRTVGRVIARVDVAAISVLKTYDPSPSSLAGLSVTDVRRFGKFLDLDVDGLHLVIHLARAGWLHWREQLPSTPVGPGRGPLALRVHLDDGSGFDLTEQGTQKKLARLGPDPLAPEFTVEVFSAILDEHARTQLKGLLRDQSVIAGVGNAYSDEILHVARMSPFRLAGSLDADERAALLVAIVSTLEDAVSRSLGLEAANLKGEKKTGMRVHGRTGLPCPVCGDTVREVSFADSSLQYCPTCQTGGKPLADRRMSKLLR
jgi:formamidopyrimidine-DNA glycosylase